MSDKNRNRSRERKKQPAAIPMRERAAFQVALFSNAAEPAEWQTQAYHEETDTRTVIEGLPAAALLEWMLAIVGIPSIPATVETIELPIVEQVPEPEIPIDLNQIIPEPVSVEQTGPATDFTRIHGIGPVIQERLMRAGIASYAAFARQLPAQLAEIVDISGLAAERILVWQQQANQLAHGQSAHSVEEHPMPVSRGDSQNPRQPVSLPTPEIQNELTMLEIALDPDDQITRVMLLQPTDTHEQPHDPLERTARFFIDAAPFEVQRSLELEIELSELEVEEEIRAANPPRLQASLAITISGLGVASTTKQQARYACYLLALDLQRNTTEPLAALHAQLQPKTYHYPLELALRQLAAGRYRVLAVVFVAGAEQPAVAIGPKLWVQ